MVDIGNNIITIIMVIIRLAGKLLFAIMLFHHGLAPAEEKSIVRCDQGNISSDTTLESHVEYQSLFNIVQSDNLTIQQNQSGNNSLAIFLPASGS